MPPLQDTVQDTIDKLQDLEYKLQTPELTQELFKIRRTLQHGYHDHLKQGSRIPLMRELVIECPECQQTMQDSDHLYLHLRQKHKTTEEEAAKKSTAATRQHTDDVLKLSSLLEQYTEVQLEDDFSS